ncbi:hypothetical protein EJB05_17492, partial [Eragrostis curvula]
MRNMEYHTVPLPEPDARQAMFEGLLPSTPGMEIHYNVLVEKTEGYSGFDIRLVCKEAAMQPLRRLMAVLESRQEVPEDGVPVTEPERRRCRLGGEQLVLYRQGEERQRLDLELLHKAGGECRG